MALRYKIIESKKVVCVVGEGTITLEELLSHIERLAADPQYHSPMKKLVDYRRALTMGQQSNDLDLFLRKLVSYRDVFKNERCAIVANNDLIFGMSRIVGSRIEPENIDLNVFRDFQKALEWLEVELTEKDFENI